MSKCNENQKGNLELERNINSYLKKKIEGGGKNYKEDYFERRKFETSFDDVDQSATEEQDIMENLFKDELSEEDILYAEQFFNDYELLKAYQCLSDKQKLVIYMKCASELSGPLIAKRLGISKQAVAKRYHAAHKILQANYKR